MFFDISIKRHLKIKETENQIYIASHPMLSKDIAHYTIELPNTNKSGYIYTLGNNERNIINIKINIDTLESNC